MSLIPRFSVSEFVAIANETLSYAFPVLELAGEVSSFKISKNKWVFFDLKDASATVSCFMTVFNLRVPLEDGMRVVVSGTPKLTDFGRFSFTVSAVKPVGEGSIKKAFDLLKEKLTREGLFDPARKRPLPADLSTIGLISSTTAAGYADFLKILNARWGGLKIQVANVGVQGASAADEITQAIDLFNERVPVDVIVIVRGGGSRDDLAVFNDELLARKIAASKIPVLTGIGHEVDESLADLAADVRASTPSNAAELLVKDKHAEISRLRDNCASLSRYLAHYLDSLVSANRSALSNLQQGINAKISQALADLQSQRTLLESFNPEAVLKQGYAILSGDLSPGSVLEIQTYQNLIKAKVQNVHQR